MKAEHNPLLLPFAFPGNYVFLPRPAARQGVMRKLMTTRKLTIILTPILFIVATLLTFKEKAFVDGLDEYGFPFRFYTFSYCQQIECIEQTGFDIISLTFNIIITATVAFVIAKVKNKFYGPTNE